MRRTLPFLLVLALLAVPQVTHAQTCSRVTWLENRSQSFAFQHPSDDVAAAGFAQAFASQLDQDFKRFAALFERAPTVPISVRVYPTEQHYHCLNALAPELSPDGTHGHVGTREIALISESIKRDPQRWQREALNALRYELAILFVEYLTNGQAPPGLQIGIGTYAQDPALTFEARLAEAPPPMEAPSATWRTLWEEPDLIAQPDWALQNASIVAYLVDVHGWPEFIDFLNALPTSESYRRALLDTYGTEMGALQTHWQVYYPVFFQGRWRANVIYGFDLTVFEQLIAAGAYADAADGLQRAIAFLVQLGDAEKVVQAEELNIRALAGLEADGLVRQSRQALQEGEYAQALDFAAQARARYDILGDTRRLAELDAYQRIAREVIELRAELADIRSRVSPVSGVEHAPRLVQIGARLGELGDRTGLEQANRMLDSLSTQRQARATLISVFGLLLVSGLLFIRLYLSGGSVPVEVELQS